MSLAGTKPITLITATPGGGKTALVVKLMMEAQKEGRPLFVMGIPDLKLDHSPLPPIAEWTEQRADQDDPTLKLAYFCFPPNSLVVIDEAQRVYRPRSAATKVPDHVAAFETVRHTGVTFILITQNPSLMDSHIRGLVGQHIHLRDVGVFGRYYYEWPELGRIESYSTAPIKKKYKLPKETFLYYKSSSMHIKRQYNIPPHLIMMIVCLIAVIALGWRMYSSLHKRIAPENTKPVLSAADARAKAGQNGMTPPALPALNSGNVAAADMLAASVPVLPNHPESAPMYAALRNVKEMPRVTGGACITSNGHESCTCYTQQGTEAEIDSEACSKWVKHRPFDPYQGSENLASNRPPAGAPGVIVSDGVSEQTVAPKGPIPNAPGFGVKKATWPDVDVNKSS